MRLIGVIAVGLAVLYAATPVAQQSPVPPTEAESAIRAEKGAFLVAAVRRELPVEPQRLAESIRTALVDTDPAIRQLALGTISARNLVPTVPTNSPEMKSEWERERPALQGLRPMVVQALDDEDERVRLGAVGALQSLDFDGTQPYGRLSAETASFLARRYGSEPSSTVRSLIVGLLGVGAKQNPAAVSTLRTATRDQAPSVRQIALKSMMMALGPEVGVPAVAAALTDSDATVRAEAAAQLWIAGPAARPYARQMEEALKAESDNETRAFLTRALERLR